MQPLMFWNEQRCADAVALKSKGLPPIAIAVELTRKYGRPVTPDAVRRALLRSRDRAAIVSATKQPPASDVAVVERFLEENAAVLGPDKEPAAAPPFSGPDPLGETQECEPVSPDAEPAAPPAAPPISQRLRFAPLPPAGLELEELIEHRIRRYRAKDSHERARLLIPVELPDDLPIGILHFGDPHLDDDGCDLGLVRAHGELVRNTPGLYAATVGDLTNNWIGRLTQLYGAQATTEGEAWRLAEWFIRDLIGNKWLYLVKGNHDAWSGVGDPLDWICAGIGAVVQDSEIRVALRFPGGREVRIKCRHSFPGSSIYNDAHGPMRALMLGQRDHLAVCGHTHKSAHAELKDSETGITMHALQVGAYKNFDHYAREKGFPDRMLGPCALTVIDPRCDATDPDQIKVFWGPAAGAKYLTMLRGGR